jgi:hypothetical protein
MKALIACAAAIGLVGATLPQGDPASTAEGIAPDVRPEIVRVDCLTSRGTAFYIGPNLLLSVAHVTSAKGCFINGKPFEVFRPNAKQDFTLIRVADPVDKWLKIDCSGFHGGDKYTAWGFARGLDTLTSVDITSTGQMLWGFSRLWGVFNVIPGQSGGPITPENDPEHVVGTVNVYDASVGNSGSVALKDTPLCSHS